MLLLVIFALVIDDYCRLPLVRLRGICSSVNQLYCRKDQSEKWIKGHCAPKEKRTNPCSKGALVFRKAGLYSPRLQ